MVCSVPGVPVLSFTPSTLGCDDLIYSFVIVTGARFVIALRSATLLREPLAPPRSRDCPGRDDRVAAIGGEEERGGGRRSSCVHLRGASVLVYPRGDSVDQPREEGRPKAQRRRCALDRSSMLPSNGRHLKRVSPLETDLPESEVTFRTWE